MKLGEIFGDALKYPISNPQSLIIVGVIFLIANLTTLLAQFGVRNSAFATIWTIVALVVSLLLVGYGLSILKNAIDLGDDIPSFDWMNNFIDGIKVLVVQVVYMIVPTIVSIIVGYATMGPALSRIFTPANISQMATNSIKRMGRIILRNCYNCCNYHHILYHICSFLNSCTMQIS